MGGIISNLRINHRRVPIKSDFSFGQILGIGGFGIVREIRRVSTNEWFISKEFNLLTIIKYKNSLSTVILNELSSLKSLSSHQFIIKLYAAFRDSNSVFFVMDLLSGGDLRLHIRLGEQFSDFQTSYVIGCIGSALQHIHSHGIIHRDVKPENIMFNRNGIPKLIDFGICNLFSTNIAICQRQSGTREYLSPENLTTSHYHGFESDFWSLGVVMYEMLYRKRPQQEIISSNMILYSSIHYEAIWETMLEQQHYSTINLQNYEDNLKSFPQKKVEVDPLNNNKYINSCTPSNNTNTKTSIYSPPSEFLDFGHFFTLFQNDPSCIKFDSDLIYSIPEINKNLEPISDSCKDMLLGLLDVRIHQRIGVGDRCDSFIFIFILYCLLTPPPLFFPVAGTLWRI